MKFSVDDIEVFSLSDTKMKVIKNEISSATFEADMKRRTKYIIEHKYERCFTRLKDEWEPKLVANGVETIPTDKDEFAELVFAQPEYKDKLERESEEAPEPS